jgi:hypothetical protein
MLIELEIAIRVPMFIADSNLKLNEYVRAGGTKIRVVSSVSLSHSSQHYYYSPILSPFLLSND